MLRPSLKEVLRHTREAVVCEMDLGYERVMRDGGMLHIQPVQVSWLATIHGLDLNVRLLLASDCSAA